MRACLKSTIALADPRGCLLLISSLLLCLAPCVAQSAPPDKGVFIQEMRMLYYTPTTAGLRSFSCDARLDWHGILERASAGKTIPADAPAVVYLNKVKISFTATMDGKSNIDWTQPTGEFPGEVSSYNQMKGGVQQMLQGFFQFWAPNINGTLLPGPKDDFRLVAENGGYRIYVSDAENSVEEVVDHDRVFKELHVKTPSMAGDFALTFSPSPEGLKITGADGNVSQNGGAPAHIRFGLDYQPVGGFQVPRNVSMEVVNVGRFDYIFENCKTSGDVKPLPSESAPK